jgi:hypothetical protein
LTFGERFLTAPELFPVRHSGERWGDETFALDLPGGPYRATGLASEQRAALAERYTESQRDDAAIDLVVFRAPESDFRPIDTRGWEYSLDFDGPAIAGMRLMARIDAERAAIWTPVADREHFAGVFENVLRPLVAMRLLAAGGLLVHSAAVLLGERALLFAGPSGSGKSTTARMALDANHEVLSDDLNAIVRDGERFMVVPLPFTGDLTRDELTTRSAPLRAIVRLEKGSEESFRAMSLADGVSLLVRSSPYVNRDAASAELLLDRATELARAAQLGVLTFRRDGDVWPILDRSCP